MVLGEELYDLARRLYPLRRSLTGEGVRQTLSLVSEWAPLERHEVPSGTRVFDWIVPPEWNVKAAWIARPDGTHLVDLEEHALHLVGYSEPVAAQMSGAELDRHLHSLPDHPDWIPYRTAYYERTWGFCLAQSVRDTIDPEAVYEVRIDATLDAGGSLTYGDYLIPGRGGAGEILISTYVCHPALANDNAAGIAVVAGLARSLAPGQLRRAVRFVFSPSGVGTLAWLQRHQGRLASIRAGLVVACAGDAGPLAYKQSRRGDAMIDRAAAQVLAGRRGATLRGFVPWGTDERQFCSPGFDLPVGVLTRTPNGMYPEYHTSADNLDLIAPQHLADTLAALLEIVEAVDANDVFLRTEPHGEPQLSRHALEGTMTGSLLRGGDREKQALFWLLNLADGDHDLLAIAERAEIPIELVDRMANNLEQAGLLRRRDDTP
jgi:aminopeptidase-like protein